MSKRARAAAALVWGARALVSLMAASALVAMLGFGAAAMLGRPLVAPDWLRARIAARIDSGFPGLRAEFGRIDLVVAENWRPRARLSGFRLLEPGGNVVFRLASADAQVALRPLLRGRLEPAAIRLNGASALLRRRTDGSVSLTFAGSAAARGAAAASPAALLIQLDDMMMQPGLRALYKLELANVSLRYEDARAGRALSIDDGAVTLRRDGSDLSVSATAAVLSGDSAASLDLGYETEIGVPDAALSLAVEGLSAHDFSAFDPALAWLDVLRAPVSARIDGSIRSDGNLGPVSGRLDIAAGAFQPRGAGTAPLPFDAAHSIFTYRPQTGTAAFDELWFSAPWMQVRARGGAILGGLEEGRLRDLVGQVTVDALSSDLDGLYDAPVTLEQVSADFRVSFAPFRVELGEALIRDGDATLRAAGTAEAGADGWRVALDAGVDALDVGHLRRLWPQGLAPERRSWAERVFQRGTLDSGALALRLAPGAMPVVHADMAFSGAQFRPIRSLPAIAGASGRVGLENGRLAAHLNAGSVAAPDRGAIDLSGSSFVIPALGKQERTPAALRLRGQGSIADTLAILDSPPFRVLRATDLTPDFAEGTLAFGGNLLMTMVRKRPAEDLSFGFSGIARDVRSAALIPGRELTAARLAVDVSDREITVAGQGRAGAVPFDAAWTQPIGQAGVPGQVRGTAVLSPEAARSFDLRLPAGTLNGQAQSDFSLRIGGGVSPLLTLGSDLRGLGIAIPQLDWRKPAAASGRLEVSVRLGPRPEVDTLALDAAGLSVRGRVTTAAGGGVERAVLSRVALGDWLDVQVELIGQGPGAPMRTVLRGGRMDLRGLTPGENAGGGAVAAGEDALRAALGELRITDSIALTGFEGQFALRGGIAGPFRGAMNGGTPVTGRIDPQNGRTAIRLRADDAGAALRDAGLLKKGRGGALDLTLLSGSLPGKMTGTLAISDIYIQDAPSIAALLNAVSVVGLLDELSGQGILFSDVNARFTLDPGRIALHEASAVGPSLGLSMDGIYDLAAQRLNMQGVVSPFYLLNGIGSFMTRSGEGLIGLSYRLRGPVTAPAVQVNPLSALLPGVLREVFRDADLATASEPDEDMSMTDGLSEPEEEEFEGR